MAFDESLAARVRSVLATRRDTDERRMFGGIAFLHGGHMIAGVQGDSLVLRLGPEGAARALSRAHTRPMDFTGKPLASMVYVDPPGLRRDADLRSWIERALDFARELPAKQPAQRNRRAKRA
jgi:TfoX/Sxy family transcriptional regulator of competence genes